MDSLAPTVHERVMVAELLRMEAMSVSTIKAIIPVIGDVDLRADATASLHNGEAHVRTLLEYCKNHGLAY